MPESQVFPTFQNLFVKVSEFILWAFLPFTIIIILFILDSILLVRNISGMAQKIH